MEDDELIAKFAPTGFNPTEEHLKIAHTIRRSVENQFIDTAIDKITRRCFMFCVQNPSYPISEMQHSCIYDCARSWILVQQIVGQRSVDRVPEEKKLNWKRPSYRTDLPQRIEEAKRIIEERSRQEEES
eukprot:TRINITY_DN6316_c0_g2_i2.p1 TRINITY_DN6316_c0_g2~~TRINITY_DN6316_c0_g2_i2.p1  ORF type:complete len:149 (+),score=26.73 TRINITY_DN6316_c0_g2_i2:62-448(+)